MGPFWLGLIEGFYGRSWEWSDRLAYADFLKTNGYHTYIYAPKSDTNLRRQWRAPLASSLCANLAGLGEHYHARGLGWGVGLSPLGYGSEVGDKTLLIERAKQLVTLGANTLCLLFDDMKLPASTLARAQVEAVTAILDAGVNVQLILCPTYYCDDPILDNIFGPRPPNYLQDLGKGLPEGVEVFWTGSSVLVEHHRVQDFAQVSEQLQRKPVLWDNYPVNDGRKTSNFLHLLPFIQRPSELANCLAGHVVNPMNQAWLSRIPLSTLRSLYSEAAIALDLRFAQALVQVDEPTRALLVRDAQCFAQQGLGSLSAEDLGKLSDEYQALDSPWAQEIADWLAGEYVFDPDCLND